MNAVLYVIMDLLGVMDWAWPGRSWLNDWATRVMIYWDVWSGIEEILEILKGIGHKFGRKMGGP